MKCSACQRDIPAASRFCPNCGAAFVSPSASDQATIDPVQPPPVAPAGAPLVSATPRSGVRGGAPLSGTSSSIYGRFAPGQMLAERYRIVGLLGAGGMGEVYRAEDLTLGQHVALKFLPPALAVEPSRLTRFLSEVRTTRQISHPSVCRVYDVAELEGQYFLSMEYIDGEDLSSLLRRIGRLPRDKALEIARQVCAGLAAAHEQGVVHRDLKPANIMLDGRGRARITDFGVAGVAATLNATGDITAGTPAYMAPEQLAGQSITARSDIYSLGLVLYELFTGRPAWAGKAESLAELRRLHESSAPANPSSLVDDMDPLVERVIMRCLERDPAHRPPTALAVAAALPGGDPLAAALAAGETPSPEMVARSGSIGAMKPGVAVAWLAGAIVFLGGMLALARLSPTSIGRLAPEPPQALEFKAKELIASIGPPAPSADEASGFTWSAQCDDWHRAAAQVAGDPKWWGRLAHEWTPSLRFFYRASPATMTPTYATWPHVELDDPPQIIAGSVRVELDARGRLLRYERVPPRTSEAAGPSASDASSESTSEGEPAPAPAVDWSKLIAATGLDPAKLTPDASTWAPLTAADDRRAWTGEVPTDPPMPIRIEAASEAGQPVFFRVLHPWSKPDRGEPPAAATGAQRISLLVRTALLLSAIAGAALLAWRHARLGRADRRGATVVGLTIFLSVWVGSAVAPQNLSTVFSLNWMGNPIFYGLYSGFLGWLCYMGVEPIVRKLWPGMMISWARVLAGRFRDPLVGRDLLIGVATGAAFNLMLLGHLWLNAAMGVVERAPRPTALDTLRGEAALASHLLRNTANSAISIALLLGMMLIGCRIIFRTNRGATIAMFLVFAFVQATIFSFNPVGITLAVIAAALISYLLVGVGVLALMAFLFLANVIVSLPLTAEIHSWAFGTTLITMVLVAAVAIYGFVTAVGGQRLIKHDALDV